MTCEDLFPYRSYFFLKRGYYTRYIAEHSEWLFVKVYADEGISGTSTKLRVGFNEMIEDALAGKIDLIVTKSISRFVRNTIDTLYSKEHIIFKFKGGTEIKWSIV